MKRFIVTLAALLLVPVLVSAEEVYDGLAKDNPDLKSERMTGDVPASEVGPDPDAEIYHTLNDDNPDLPTDVETTKEPTEDDPEIYEQAEPGNPDLTY